MKPSVFRRVTRYSPSASADPRENRLTEVFAAVLEQVDGLGSRLVNDWLGTALTQEFPAVSTQVPTASGFCVDLELRFGSFEDPELLVWVENKHGADLGERQLERYATDLDLRASRAAALVLLAPRDAFPEDHPADTHVVSWQDVAATLERVGSDPGVPSPARWLLDQFATFLKDSTFVT